MRLRSTDRSFRSTEMILRGSSERDLDKQAFEYRQKQLRDEEVLKAREGEVRKTGELDH